MQIDFTEDQVRFREVVARFMQDKSQPAVVRQLMESEAGFDADVWRQLSGELGLTGTHLPENLGGYGFGPIELGIALEEMGRFLYCGPFFASAVMAAGAVLIAGSEAAKIEILPGIAAGTTVAALVLDDLNDLTSAGREISASGGELNGVAPLVVDAGIADLLIVIADSAEGLGLYTVRPGSEGVSIDSVEALDPTRKLSSVAFSGAAAQHIGALDVRRLDSLWDYISVALAHEMVGGTQHLLDSTVEYTKLRYQFGRPVGSFQGLKHRLADLLMEVELAKAATHHAAFCLATGDGDPEVASMAKAMASDAYVRAAKEAIQMRGGIGFTWEEDTHLWFKRAKSSEVFMGSPSRHRERMVSLMEMAS